MALAKSTTAAELDLALSRTPTRYADRPKVIASSKTPTVQEPVKPLSELATEAVFAFASQHCEGREVGPEEVRGVMALAHIKLLWDAVELSLLPEEEQAIRQRLEVIRVTGEMKR